MLQRPLLDPIKPRLFIGSSGERLEVAHALQENLERDAEVVVWPQDIFSPTESILGSLIENLDKYDFAAFVFAADDITRIRDTNYQTVRDNVIFELGLFIGRLGQVRTFIVAPRGSRTFHIPSDLQGITLVEYESNRSDGNLRAALGPPSNRIRKVITEQGSIGKNVLKIGKYEHNMIREFIESSIREALANANNGTREKRTLNIDISGHSLWGTVRPKHWGLEYSSVEQALQTLRKYDKAIGDLDLQGVLFQNIKEVNKTQRNQLEISLRILLLHPKSEQAKQVYEAQQRSPRIVESLRDARADIYLSIYVLNKIAKFYNDLLSIEEIYVLPKAQWMPFSLIRIHDNMLHATYPCTQLLDRASCVWIYNNNRNPFKEYVEKFETVVNSEDGVYRIPLQNLTHDSPSEFKNYIDGIIGIR